MKLHNILIFAFATLMIALIYIILSETLTLASLLIGVVLGACSLVVCIIFFSAEFISRYNANFLKLFGFMVVFVFIIIISGLKSLVLGLSKNATSQLTTYTSSLKSDMLCTLLANAITLTPGTVTVDKNGNTLKIMRLCKRGHEDDMRDITRLENMIAKAETRQHI